MSKKIFFLFLFFSFVSSPLFSQTSNIKGNVKSPEGENLAGVGISIKGTTKGVYSDGEGNFEISAKIGDVLVFSYIGYVSKEVEVVSFDFLNVVLSVSEEVLEDVVVTALGIKKSKKALSYAVSEIKGDELAGIKEANIINTLSGKVAGVQVSSNSTGPSGSTRVIIRGNNSLTGNNQPLYVIDGVPMDNSNLGSAGMWGGQDLGDGISSINPDNIESMTVLKGASAAALYGNRAQNGVILITTKSGKNVEGVKVELSSNTTFETPLSGFDDIQTEYGSGSRGDYPKTKDEALQFGRSSWGAKMEGQEDRVIFDGTKKPYKNYGNNYYKFNRVGYTSTNTVSFLGGKSGIGNFLFAVSRMDNQAMVPNSNMNRNNFNLRLSSSFYDDFSIDAKINYINENVNNRIRMSDGPGNQSQTLSAMPVSTDVLWMKDKYEKLDDLGNLEHIPYNNSIYRPNPYWALNRMTDYDNKDRIIGFLSLNYNITDFLSLMVRAGQDAYNLERYNYDYWGTPTQKRGQVSYSTYKVAEKNYDFLFNFKESIDDIGIVANVGANLMTRDYDHRWIRGNELNITDLMIIGNAKNQSNGRGKTQKETQSVYGSLGLDYVSYIFLNFTARYDITSTLPKENNSYFYPSVSASFILSEIVDMNDAFVKLRASFAQIGGDTDPYKLNLNYRLEGQGHVNKNGVKAPLGVIANGDIPLLDLKPTMGTSYEVGLDIRLFDNRLKFDVALYDKTTENQILSNTIANSSGYGSKVINAGSINNKGLEFLVDYDAYRSDDFSWNTSFNFSTNVNEVISLDKLPSLRLGESRSRVAYIEAVPKKTYGALVGRGYKRDEKGRIVHNQGLPVRTDDNIILGNSQPDFVGGWANTFRYKNLSLKVLLDIKMGGKIYSYTNAMLYSSGLHSKTVNTSDKDKLNGIYSRDEEKWITDEEGSRELVLGGIIGKGVKKEGDAYVENDVMVPRQSYYSRITSQIAEEFIYDASYIKVKQVSLAYNVPKSIISDLNIESVSVAFVASNLWFLYKLVPNVDPESNYNSGNAQGLEHGGAPTPRSLGFSLNVKF